MTETKDTPKKCYDVNRRAVKAFVSIGKGHRGSDMFCMALNMKPIHFRTFQSSIRGLHTSSRAEVEKNLAMARNEVRKSYSKLDDKDDTILDITVSYDGSWQKRGFTSKYGIGCCIEILTGLVIDFEVLSKFCNQCEVQKRKTKPEEFQKWYTSHKSSCNQNYVGTSPGMEVEAAERLRRRSESLGFRYTTMLSDGERTIMWRRG